MTGTSALIPAAGKGKRFGKGFNKVLAEVAGKPIIAHTLSVFQQSPVIDDITVVTGREDIAACEEIVRRFGFTKVAGIVEGGSERQESVRKGLLAVSPQAEIIVIHDGARPFVNEKIIAESASAAKLYGAAIAAIPVSDTIKSADDRAFVTATIARDQLYSIQTPQTFRRQLILDAHEKAAADGYIATDDAALVEHMGLEVKIIPGARENIKVTQPEDMAYMQARLSAQVGPQPVRTGFGYDIHRFAPERKLFLGGVEFHGEEGLLGHSDADVLLHAICDALLGAAGLGDIGRHFPDTDPQYKGISSMSLLNHVAELLTSECWVVVNIDVTLVGQRPKIASRAQEMIANISSAVGIGGECINIKATTAEGLGAIGRAEGISCYAVANLIRVAS